MSTISPNDPLVLCEGNGTHTPSEASHVAPVQYGLPEEDRVDVLW